VIQVRDMTVTALFGIMIARLKGVQFFYWLSYPISEGYIERARAIGFKGGVRFWLPLMQGTFGKWLIYRVVLPRADHIFVQSHQMQLNLAKEGIPMSTMTPVPMGVDTEISSPESIKPSYDSRLKGKRVLVYLGSLDRVRQIEIIFQMLVLIKHQIPNILLILVGDSDDASHRDWLKREVKCLDIVDNVVWTGWLLTQEAWSYVRSAEIGLSPCPRGYLLDCASPTKMLEYMAFGLPVIVNDNPDQAQVIKDSGAGICVKLQPSIFAESVIRLLSDKRLCNKMGSNGRQYVTQVRAYDFIASSLAIKYHALYFGSC
jgi:glycosyltransferase involved in cell wall biosynthesis